MARYHTDTDKCLVWTGWINLCLLLLHSLPFIKTRIDNINVQLALYTVSIVGRGVQYTVRALKQRDTPDCSNGVLIGQCSRTWQRDELEALSTRDHATRPMTTFVTLRVLFRPKSG